MNNAQPDNKLYSAEEILHYLSGKMDRSGMHALERQALDDEMLAEAVEGYRLALEKEDAATVLGRVIRLTQIPAVAAFEKPAAKVASLSGYQTIKYAAAAVIIAGVGWFLFSITRPENILPSEISTIMQQDEAVAPPTQREANDVAATDVIPEKSGESSTRNAIAGTQAAKEVPTTIQVPAAATDLAMEVETNKAAEAKAGTIQSTAKGLELQRPPTVAGETTALSRRLAAAPVVTTDTLSRKSTAAATEDLQEVVVSGLLDARGRAQTGPVIAVDTLQATPAISWEKFNAYILDKLPFDQPGKDITLTIQLNEQNEIESIEASGSVDKNLLDTLKTIIREGPDWKTKTNKNARAKLLIRL